MSNPAISSLHNRVSCGQLQSPPPAGADLLAIQKAALRAADHGILRPWRFLVVEGEGLKKLGDIFFAAKKADKETLSETELERFKSMPLRAPMIITVIASPVENHKVPEIEQLLSAAAAAQNIINAAFALDYGAMWRTGELAYHPKVKESLGLQEQESIIGFIYLGTPKSSLRTPPDVVPEDYFHSWF